MFQGLRPSHLSYSFPLRVVHAVPTASLCTKKVKFSLCLSKHHAMKPHLLINHHTMKTYWGSGGIVLSILNLDTLRRWVAAILPAYVLN